VKKQWRDKHSNDDNDDVGGIDVATEGLVSLIAWCRSLRIRLGLESAVPSATISAMDASGKVLVSGGATEGKVAFKFELDVKCNSRMKKLLTKDSITHNCPHAKVLGMKKTYYLECKYEEGLVVSVRVSAGAFRDDYDVPNTASSTFTVLML
jgi:hypothetical protein